MNESRRKPRTVEGVASKLEAHTASATRIIQVGIGVVAIVLAAGSTLAVMVQDQIHNLKENGKQLQQDATTAKVKAETNEQRLARLRAELAETEQDRDAQVERIKSQVQRADTKAETADDKAERKQPPKVIDRTVTKRVPAAPAPSASPTPTKPPGLGLPPLFPTNEE